LSSCFRSGNSTGKCCFNLNICQNGLLIRNRTALESARKITTVVFDKTGTLTEGKFGVSSVIVFDKKYKKKQILQFTASLEKNSEHPITKGII